jgi:three-Cys-motif partner protein
MSPTTTHWDLHAHTKAKHDILVKYLGAWFPVLSKHNGRIFFLDAFAGPGSYSKGEPGSPVLALEALLKHSYASKMVACEFLFVFNEYNKGRFDALEARLDELRDISGGWPENVKVITTNDNFTDLATDVLDQLGEKNLAPTFAFLDPFGYRDVPIDLIRRLLSYRRCELFIYFDYNSVNRFGTAGVVDDHFEALFGTDEFKNAPPAGDPMRGQFFHDLYENQLKEVCGFEYVRSFEMVNSQGRTGNYLFFCTRNLVGLDRMKAAMWSVAPSGDYRFSDIMAGQPILFDVDPDTTLLRDALQAEFAGRDVSITEVEEFTVAQTPFVTGHIKRRTLGPMQKAGEVQVVNHARKNSFPYGTILRFPE